MGRMHYVSINLELEPRLDDYKETVPDETTPDNRTPFTVLHSCSGFFERSDNFIDQLVDIILLECNLLHHTAVNLQFYEKEKNVKHLRHECYQQVTVCTRLVPCQLPQIRPQK